ncbi:MAG TPA: hypothetical protein VF177_07805 [Anaerolineae bacterium]
MIRGLLSQKDTISPTGFQWRSREVSRLEGLSDAVMGFALTLLVVSLEVPQTFDDLLYTMRGVVVPIIQAGQLPQLYLIFGVGWTAVWLVFVVLYRHALQQSERLGLSSLEVFDTRASISENLAAAAVGLVSIVLAIVGATGVAGFVYLVMFPLTWAIKRRNALRRRTIAAPRTAAAGNE